MSILKEVDILPQASSACLTPREQAHPEVVNCLPGISGDGGKLISGSTREGRKEGRKEGGNSAEEEEGETELTLLNGEHLRRGVGVGARRVAARRRLRRGRRGVCIGIGVLIVQPLLRR